MKLLVLLLLITSCGKQVVDVEDSNHTANGQIDIVIDWNIEELKEVFTDSCTEEFENQEDIGECITDKVSSFIDLINGGMETLEE